MTDCLHLLATAYHGPKQLRMHCSALADFVLTWVHASKAEKAQYLPFVSDELSFWLQAKRTGQVKDNQQATQARSDNGKRQAQIRIKAPPQQRQMAKADTSPFAMSAVTGTPQEQRCAGYSFSLCWTQLDVADQTKCLHLHDCGDHQISES